jgi:uncharacterized protein (DUF4415 family)
MNENDISKKSGTDWERLESMTDEDIDYTDIPPLDEEFFKRATIRMPKRKQAISLRLDPEVIMYFKRQGKGYQTRMNAVLKAYVDAHSVAQG